MAEMEIPQLTPEQLEEIKNNLHADQSYKMKNNPKPTPQQSHA